MDFSDDSRSRQISEFLALIEFHSEASLLIKESAGLDDLILPELKRKGMVIASDWPEVVEAFARNRPVCLRLAGALTRELYDVIMQYNRRNGIVQVLDKATSELRSIQYDPQEIYLLVVADREDMSWASSTIELSETFELIARI